MCVQVSLDAQVRETINRKMVTPSSHTFDEAQIQIYTLMQRDSYPRFLNSPTYKRLLGNDAGAGQLSQSPSTTSSPLDAEAQQEPHPPHPQHPHHLQQPQPQPQPPPLVRRRLDNHDDAAHDLSLIHI